jgi:hypothetical protein
MSPSKEELQRLIADRRQRARNLERVANHVSNPDHRRTLLERVKALDEEADGLEAEASRIF